MSARQLANGEKGEGVYAGKGIKKRRELHQRSSRRQQEVHQIHSPMGMRIKAKACPYGLARMGLPWTESP